MGFFSESAKEDDPFFTSEGEFTPDILGLGGAEGAAAARRGAELQAQSGREAIEFEKAARQEAQGFFEPFAGVAAQGLERASFLTDPQERFEFLQQDPLFKLALENANTQTQQQAAARGRLSAGDTLQQLSQNVLLSASPLIDRQTAGITNLLNLGSGITQSQANVAIGQGTNVSNLLTDIGSAQAAGGIGAAQAQQQGNQNLAAIGGSIATAFSDRRLKENLEFKEVENGHNIYSWTWNERATKLFGLIGKGFGVLANEVLDINPAAVSTSKDGFLMVNYALIGVRHSNEWSE